jgi:hypothetical protein
MGPPADMRIDIAALMVSSDKFKDLFIQEVLRVSDPGAIEPALSIFSWNVVNFEVSRPRSPLFLSNF